MAALRDYGLYIREVSVTALEDGGACDINVTTAGSAALAGITLVGSSIGSKPAANNDNIPLSMPVGHAAGDFALIATKVDLQSIAEVLVTPGTGWTMHRSDVNVTGRDFNLRLFSKVLTSGGEPDPVCATDGYADRSAVLMVFRNVDTITPFDAVTTYVEADNVSNSTPDPITTSTDKCALVLINAATYDHINVPGVPASPSGLIIAESIVGGPLGSNNNRQIVASYKLDLGTRGTVVPSIYTHTVTIENGMFFSDYTIALRPMAVQTNIATIPLAIQNGLATVDEPQSVTELWPDDVRFSISATPAGGVTTKINILNSVGGLDWQRIRPPEYSEETLVVSKSFVMNTNVLLAATVELSANQPMAVQYRAVGANSWTTLSPTENSQNYGADPSPHYQEHILPAGTWEVRAIDHIADTYSTTPVSVTATAAPAPTNGTVTTFAFETNELAPGGTFTAGANQARWFSSDFINRTSPVYFSTVYHPDITVFSQVWPVLLGPANDLPLTGSSMVLTWNKGDENPRTYDNSYMRIGSSVGSKNYLDWNADLDATTGTLTVTATGLPTDGSNIYVQFGYKMGGDWSYNDFVYQAQNATIITDPTLGIYTVGDASIIADRPEAQFTGVNGLGEASDLKAWFRVKSGSASEQCYAKSLTGTLGTVVSTDSDWNWAESSTLFKKDDSVLELFGEDDEFYVQKMILTESINGDVPIGVDGFLGDQPTYDNDAVNDAIVVSTSFVMDTNVTNRVICIVELESNQPLLMQRRSVGASNWIDMLPGQPSYLYGDENSPHYQEHILPAGTWQVRAIDYIADAYRTAWDTVTSVGVVSSWDNNEAPRAELRDSDPDVVTLYVGNNVSPVTSGTNNPTLTSGQFYKHTLSDSNDYIIRMHPSSGPLTKGLVIIGGNHLRLVGLEWNPVIQDGCDIGEAVNHADGSSTPQPTWPSFNPRMPSEGKFLHLQNNGDMFLEGIYCDMEGMEGDFCVTRNQLGSYPQFAAANSSTAAAADQADRRRWFLVNSVVKGWTSLDSWVNKDEGDRKEDGFHGDLFQNQYSTVTGKENVGTMALENCTIANYGNGITHQRQGDHNNRLSFRNVNWEWDSRWDNDSFGNQRPRCFGVCYWGYLDKDPEFDNFYIDNSLQSPYCKVKRTDEVGEPWHNLGPYHEEKPGLIQGKPTNDFATKETTGENYVSPWD